MHFPKQPSSALAFFLLAVPILAADTIPYPTPQQAKEVSTEIQSLGTALHQPGMDLDVSKPMTETDIQVATDKYCLLVGEALANCTKTRKFYVCLEAIKNADDKAKFNFERGFGSDFISGFKQGFLGTLNFATTSL